MTAYVETPSDAAFTLWLATRNARKVRAELHVRFTPVEKKILLFHTKPVVKVPKPVKPKPVPRQQFTRAQIDVALAALAAQKMSKGN